MNELVKVVGNEVFTNSLIIADGTGNEHESVVALIKNYQTDFLDFGEMQFTDLKSGKRGRPIRIYQLNEPQATFLMTLLGNKQIIVAFKKELVRQFYKMRNILFQKQTQIWQDTRQLVKEIRKKETAAINLLVDYATEQGSKHANRYYTNISLLADKIAGIEPNKRDKEDIEHLTRLSMVEDIIEKCINDGIQQQCFYKNIYQACKERLEQFREITYLNVQMKEKALTKS